MFVFRESGGRRKKKKKKRCKEVRKMAMRGIILVRTEPQETKSVLRALREVEGIREVCATIGPVDIVAHLEAREPEDLNRIVIEKVRKVKGVRETTTLLRVEE